MVTGAARLVSRGSSSGILDRCIFDVDTWDVRTSEYSAAWWPEVRCITKTLRELEIMTVMQQGINLELSRAGSTLT